jgi:hypothetical protein
MQWTEDDIIHQEHSEKYPECKDFKDEEQLQQLPKKKQQSEKVKKEKKVKGKLGNLFVESAWVDSRPAFLCIDLKTGEISSQNSILYDGITYIPPQKETEIPYVKYSFTSEEIQQLSEEKISKEQILDEIAKVVDHFVVNYSVAQTLTTVDILLTYCMDWIDLVHFPYYVGDTGSGKTSNARLFEKIGYRPMYSESVTTANIYQYLGETEEGQGIIIEDEAQDLNQDREKIKIYKNGYARGSKIPRITNGDSARIQKFYFTFGCKIFSGEKTPNDKGLLERLVIVKMIEGIPKGNIKKPTTEEKEQLTQLRKKLLCWKLQTQMTGLTGQVETDLVNRDKELWEDFLRVASETKFYESAQKVVKHFVKQRHENIENSLEAKLFHCIVYRLDENMEISIMELWKWLQSPDNSILTGKENGAQSMILDEFQEVLSIHAITSLISDKFLGKRLVKTTKGGDDKYHDKTFYRFDAETSMKLVTKYGIRIADHEHPIYKSLDSLKSQNNDTFDTSDSLYEHVKAYDSHKEQRK